MITITFASLELSPTVTRYTVIDGGFPLDYDGNTYLNDGLVVELDKTVISAELANVTQNITLFLDNDVKAAIQTDTYRNRRAKIFKGEWDASTSTLSEVRSIYEGIIDTHNTPNADGTVEFIIASLIAPLRRPSDNISLQVLHNQRIEDGVYGASNAIGPTVDTFLRNAGQSFQDFTLGASEYREAVTKPMYIKVKKNLFGNHKRKYVGEEPVSPEIQETPGSQLENPASYQPARVYGVSGVNAAIVAAWNHKTSGDFATTKQHYGTDWRGFQDEEASNAIRPDTRFGTIVYLVHAGEVDSLEIYFDGLNGDVQSRSLSLISGNTNKQYLRDEYEDENGNTQNNTYAVVEALWGANNQSPPASWIATSNGQIDANFRGVGYVLVAITYEATRDGAVSRGIPEVGFQVKQTKSLSMDIPAWSETAIASNTGYSYDDTSPYSTNSFYVENFLLLFASSKTRSLETGQSFKSAFSGGFLTLTPDSAFAADLDLAYGLSSTNLSAYNFVDGITDIQITQSGNYGKFKVVSASRNAAGTKYSLWLSGDKGNSGTIDIAQSFDFGIEETTRTGSITALTTRVANQHPSRVIVDYLMDKQVGPGLSADDIDLESFLLCQENAAKIPQYINGVMQGKDTFVEYIQDIADTANLTLYQEGDKIKCRFRKPVQASDVAVTFTENNCSDMELINFRNEDKFNEFLLTVDLQKISNVKAPRITGLPVEVRDTSYLSQDNGIRSIGDFTSEWLTLFYSETVDEDGNTTNEIDESESSEYLESYEQYARFLMDISRFYEEIELTTTYSIAKDFTIGTVFDVENDLYGFTGNNIRRYEVVDYADNHDGTISLVGQRHSNSIFGLEDDFSNNVFDSLEPTILPYTANSESAIPSAPSLTAVWEPISRRIDLSWTEPSTNAFNISHYQVQEQANDETDWTTISEQLVTSDRVFSRAIVERGGIYKYRVRALTDPSMINGPFSSEKYIRLDLAFGDNKPEQQRIIITGNRSNASVASSVDTTVTIGLPTNFEAAPADETGTGATSNIGQLGVDLDVTSDFVSAATDSDSGTTATSSTALPGTPSGGSYEVIDTFQAALTGSTSATDATSTTGTFNLSNSAGSIAITSDFSEATTGRFPASGTSVSAVTSQALPNGAGTLTVTSDFTASESASLSGEATHSMAALTDIGTQTGSTSGVGTYNDIGTTDIDLTVSSFVASATTSSGSTGARTQPGSDSTIARTVVVGGQPAVLGTLDRSGTITTDPFTGSNVFVAGTGTIGGDSATYSSLENFLVFGSSSNSSSHPNQTSMVSGDTYRIVIDDGVNTPSVVYKQYGFFSRTFFITTYYWGFQSIPTLGHDTDYDIDIYKNAVEPNFSITSQTAGSGWSNNAATLNTSTGVVSFPQQDKTRYEISDVPSGSDIELAINGATIDEVNTSTEFGDNNTSRSWTLTGGIPIGLGTQTDSTSGAGTYNDIGTTDIDLTVSSFVASAMTSSTGAGTKTQPGSDTTTARTAVVIPSTTVLPVTFPVGSTFGSTVTNSGFTNVTGSNVPVSTSTSGYSQYTGVNLYSYKDGYSLNGTPIRLWTGVVDANINIGIVMAAITKPGQLGGTAYHISTGGASTGTGDIGSNIVAAYSDLFNNMNSSTSTSATVPNITTSGFAISPPQSAGAGWSNNAATINSSTGVVSFPSQVKTTYTLTNGSSTTLSDVDLTVEGVSTNSSSMAPNDTLEIGFGDTGSARSWVVSPGVAAQFSLTGSGDSNFPIITNQSLPGNYSAQEAAEWLADYITSSDNNLRADVKGSNVVDDRTIRVYYSNDDVTTSANLALSFTVNSGSNVTSTNSTPSAYSSYPGVFKSYRIQANRINADNSRSEVLDIPRTMSASYTTPTQIGEYLRDEIIAAANASNNIDDENVWYDKNSGLENGDYEIKIGTVDGDNYEFVITENTVLTDGNAGSTNGTLLINNGNTSENIDTPDTATVKLPGGIVYATLKLGSNESIDDILTRIETLIQDDALDGYTASLNTSTHELVITSEYGGNITGTWLIEFTSGSNTGTLPSSLIATETIAGSNASFQATLRDPWLNQDDTFLVGGTTADEVAESIASRVNKYWANWNTSINSNVITITAKAAGWVNESKEANGATVNFYDDSFDSTAIFVKEIAYPSGTNGSDTNLTSGTFTVASQSSDIVSAQSIIGHPTINPTTLRLQIDYASGNDIDETITFGDSQSSTDMAIALEGRLNSAAVLGVEATRINNVVTVKSIDYNVAVNSITLTLDDQSKHNRFEFTGNGSQTEFVGLDNLENTLGYTSGFVQVKQNGSVVTSGITVTNGTSLVFSSPPADGDSIVLIAPAVNTTVSRINGNDLAGSGGAVSALEIDLKSFTDGDRPYATNEFNLSKFFPIVANNTDVVAEGFGFAFKADPPNNINGIAYTSYVERIQLPVDNSVEYQKSISYVQLLVENGNVNVKVNGMDSPGKQDNLYNDHNTSVINSKEFDYASDYKLDFRVAGRVLNYKIEDAADYDVATADYKGWRVSGVGFKIEAAESRGKR